jgi:hypothetical protein
MGDRMKLWALVNPDEQVVDVFKTKANAWFKSFEYQTRDFQEKYWKRPKASQQKLKRDGWAGIEGKRVQR